MHAASQMVASADTIVAVRHSNTGNAHGGGSQSKTMLSVELEQNNALVNISSYTDDLHGA